jgi:hypothetical protein
MCPPPPGGKPLAAMVTLKSLNMRWLNAVSDLAPLTALVNLKTLGRNWY